MLYHWLGEEAEAVENDRAVRWFYQRWAPLWPCLPLPPDNRKDGKC